MLAKFEETDGQPTGAEPLHYQSESPPPIPPRLYEEQHTYYQYVSHRVTLSEAERTYMMDRLPKLNSDLINLHGEARIEGNNLEVRPLNLAKTVPGWDGKVALIVKQNKQDFQTASIPFDNSSKGPILEYLIQYHQTHKDFHLFMDETHYKISGSSSSITKALEHINNLVEEEVEVTRELERPPRYIDYFMKFAKKELESLRPSVTITRSKDNPGLLSVKGVKQSLDAIEKLAHEKLAQLHTEYVPLTQTSHRLLSSPQGKTKLNYHLGTEKDVICYVFEKIEPKEDFTHQVCIMSSDSSSLAIAKKMFESLCKDEKIFVPQEKFGFSSTHEWQTIVEKLGKEYFASVRTSGDVITITGGETDVMKVSHEIKTFLETQDEATDEFAVEGPVWQVLRIQHDSKLMEVKKEAKRHKVYLNFPEVDEAAKSVIITLQGNLQYVQNVKVQLKHIVDEVCSKEMLLPPKPGVQKVIDKGTIGKKCHELSQYHKVVIRYEVEEDASPLASKSMFSSSKHDRPNAPQRLINATSNTGVSVSVYKGDYARLSCDAFVTFIPEKPTFNEPVFTALTCTGGQELCNSFELSLGTQRLIPATIHPTSYTGDLECNEIFHVVLPPYTHGGRVSHVLNTALMKALEQGSINNSRIVFCPPTIPPLNYPADLYAQAFISALSSANTGMYSTDLNIKVFVDDSHDAENFEKVMRDSGFQIYHRDRFETIQASVPKVVNQRGNASTLEKVIKIQKGNIIDFQVRYLLFQKRKNIVNL